MQPVTKILLPVDGTPASLQAVRHVIYLVRGGLRAGIVLAHVQEGPGPLEVFGARDPAAIGRAGAEAGHHLLQPARDLLDEAGLAFDDEVVMADGDPAHRHHCASIVIGAKRTGLLRHVLLGSLSRTLLQESPIPVTVVREPAHAAKPARRHREDGGGTVADGGGSTGSGRGKDDADDGPGGDGPGDGGGGDGGGGGD
jgi:nucleotide-binding universal stress UspA family protein